MDYRSWQRHIIRLLILAAAVALAGWYSGRLLFVALIALGLYTLWQTINIARLLSWLRDPESRQPKSLGAWGDIFDSMTTMEQSNRDRKQQYQLMIEDFQTLTDAFPDATLVVDEQFNITWFNRAAGRLLELRTPRDIGRPITTAIRNQEFSHWLSHGDEREPKLELRAPGHNEVWLDVSSVPIRESQHLIILRDVTEVHRVERLRRDFVTNVSHELRTPLTVMLGYLEIFQDRPQDELSDALQRMHTQAVQMHSMLDDFLELSRLQAIESDDEEERVDVAAMLMQLKEQAEEISRGDHELKFDIEGGLALFGITSDLESAFRNLIVNAVKYTQEGGTITVTWRDGSGGPSLTVQDTGIGIPQREIPRLTERFYRVGSDRGRKSGGTGLGLAIVKHVMNAHEARLVIESEVGVGSVFRCIFPPERKRS